MTLSSQILETKFGNLFDQIPILRDRIGLSELTGGITNRNIVVTTPNKKFVARISSNKSSLLSIDRQVEFENSKIAAENNIGADVYEYHPQHGLLIIGFLEGQTYSSHHVANNLSRVAQSCRQLHESKPFVRDFDMFQVQKSYLSIVQKRGFKLPEDYLDYQKYIDILKTALNSTPVQLVPCNNDLLPANFIDDGKKIWIIDYEYSGNNDPCFELGNIWSEAKLSYPQLIELVNAYYTGHRPEKIARAWLFAVLAKYSWTLWASIQDSISDINFDFWSWGLEKYEDSKRLFLSDQFQQELRNL